MYNLEIEALKALSTYYLDREQYEGILEIEYAPSIIQIDKSYILKNCVPLLVIILRYFYFLIDI